MRDKNTASVVVAEASAKTLHASFTDAGTLSPKRSQRLFMSSQACGLLTKRDLTSTYGRGKQPKGLARGTSRRTNFNQDAPFCAKLKLQRFEPNSVFRLWAMLTRASISQYVLCPETQLAAFSRGRQETQGIRPTRDVLIWSPIAMNHRC